MKRVPILSDPVSAKPQFVVMLGQAPFSAHVLKYNAVHNAKLVGGIIFPIDWVGEEMVLPALRPK